MAIIKYAECGKEVSSLAKICLNCGNNIEEQVRNTIPEMPEDLRIGAAIKNSILNIILLEDEPINALLTCHTHGLSIFFGKEIETINFSQIIDFRRTVSRRLHRTAITSSYIDTPYLSLEYWSVKSKKRVTYAIQLAEQSCIYIDENQIFSDFMSIYKKQLLNSKHSIPKDVNIKESINELIEIADKKNFKIFIGCGIFVLSFVILFAFLGVYEHLSEKEKDILNFIICPLILIIVLIIAYFIMHTISCFFRKYS